MQISNHDNRGIIGSGSNNFVNSGNITIEINDSEDELDRLLRRHISEDALRNSFYSPPECHPKTRTTVRNEIGGWIDENESAKPALLWLSGPTAAGKSVIAKTVSGSHDQIVASFFFSTSSDRSAATLFPTLAWQLARKIPDTRKHIIASLKTSGSLQTSQIEEQFDRLIIQPLRSTTLQSRPVMMIDGVDECTDEDMLVRFLRAMTHAGEAGDMPVRFIVCSRPEPRIYAILGRDRDVNPTTNGQDVHRSSKLGALILSMVLIAGIALFASIAFIAFKASASEAILLMPFTVLVAILALPLSLALVASFIPYLSTSRAHIHTPIQRIRRFLQGVFEPYNLIRLGLNGDSPFSATSGELVDALDRIYPSPVISTIQIGCSEECKKDIARYLTDKFNAIRQSGGSTSPWFQPSDISKLVEASCGQFLYASTIVRLIDESRFDPRDVLRMACRNSLPTPDLNKLYREILKRAHDTVRNQAKEGGPNYGTEWRLVTDSLAILVFFARNDHSFTVRKSRLVIETLLGLEKDKMTLKLRKMHSVLRIGVDPEESVRVYHRSFLEFLQSRKRAEEYYIGFSNGLRRTLILMFKAGFRYNKMTFYAAM